MRRTPSSDFKHLAWLTAFAGGLVACGGEPNEPADLIDTQSAALTVNAPAWAMLHADQPANIATYVPNANDQNNSVKMAGTVTRQSTGSYLVHFPNLDKTQGGGNVHVVGAGLDDRRCNLEFWGTNATSGLVEVAVSCFTPAGVPADAEFNVMYQRRNDGDSLGTYVGGYLWSRNPQTSGTADSDYSWNSKGGTNEVNRVAKGRYDVIFPQLAITPTKPAGIRGAVMVTRNEGNGHCKVESWGNSGQDTKVKVRCFSATGAAEDAMFTVAFGNLAPLGTPSVGYALADQRTAGDYRPTAPDRLIQQRGTIDTANSNLIDARRRTDIGKRYWIRFPNSLPTQRFDPFLTAVGTDATYCKAVSWFGAHGTVNLLDAAIYTNCYTMAGVSTDSKYDILYAGSNPPGN
jgi:hypothetical protein